MQAAGVTGLEVRFDVTCVSHRAENSIQGRPEGDPGDCLTNSGFYSDNRIEDQVHSFYFSD